MSDEVEQATSAEADARYPRLTADGTRANRAFVAGAAWGRASRDAEMAELRALVESQARQIAALTGSIRDISTGWDETLAQLAAERAES